MSGSFVLGAPGTFVADGPGGLHIGNRPGVMFAAVGLLFGALPIEAIL